MLPVAAHDPEREDVEAQGHDEQRQPEGEGDQCFGRSEFRVTGQLADDLDGYGRHRLEGVHTELGRRPCPHHHDHGFTDGAGGGQQDGTDYARQGGGDDHLADGFGMGRAKAERPVAHGLWDGVDDVV